MTHSDVPLYVQAADPATSAVRLTELAKLPALAALVAGNPNTPWPTIATLTLAHPQAVIQNPVLPLLALENPTFLYDLNMLAALALLRLGDLPTWAVRMLTDYVTPEKRYAKHYSQYWSAVVCESARLHIQFDQDLDASEAGALLAIAQASLHEGPGPFDIEAVAPAPWLMALLACHEAASVREHIAQRYDAPKQILNQLATDMDVTVRQAVAGNPRLPVVTALRLARDPHPHVRCEVVKHQELPRAIQERLARDPEMVVHRELASSAKTLPDTFLSIEVNPDIGSVIAANPHTPSAMLAKLEALAKRKLRYSAEYRYMLSNVAAHPNTPADTLTALAIDHDEGIRGNLARNLNTPGPTLAMLARDRRKSVAYPALQHAKMPPDELKKFAKNRRTAIQSCVARNPATPAEALVVLARGHDIDVLPFVARHPNTPPESLRQLVFDNRSRVRMALAQNPSLPRDVLAKLAKDREMMVRWRIARRPDTPPDVLAQLAQDTYPEILKAVAMHPALPPTVMAHLADDIALSRILAERPDAPPEILARLAQNKSSHTTRAAVAAHAQAPIETLAHLMKDPFAVVRCAAVQNPRTPGATITPQTPPRELARRALEHDVAIRAAVAAQPQTPHAVLLRLAHDEAGSVRKAVALNAATPPTVLVALAVDPKVHLHLGVHPQVTPELLVRLALTGNPTAQMALIKHPQTPPYILMLLLFQSNHHVVRGARETLGTVLPSASRAPAALFTPHTQNDIANHMLCDESSRHIYDPARLLMLSSPVLRAETLARHTQSLHWIERYIVARHPHADDAILQTLSDDGNRFVRAAARARLAGETI